jgi:hypothetical protein
MSTTAPGALTADDLLQLMKLTKESDSVELKLTMPEETHRSVLQDLDVDPLDAQIRQVYFFDTPDLALNQAGVVVRARRIQGRDHDSVVKLRPVVPRELPDKLRKSPDLTVEVDVMPGKYVCSASLKNTLPSTVVREAVQGGGGRLLRKVFSKEQRAFYAAHAPEGLAIDDLAVLGPIFVLKDKVTPKQLGRKVVVEMWLYPDGSRILELSTKTEPGAALQVALEIRERLEARGIDVSGGQQTKTAAALAFYVNELKNRG